MRSPLVLKGSVQNLWEQSRYCKERKMNQVGNDQLEIASHAQIGWEHCRHPGPFHSHYLDTHSCITVPQRQTASPVQKHGWQRRHAIPRRHQANKKVMNMNIMARQANQWPGRGTTSWCAMTWDVFCLTHIIHGVHCQQFLNVPFPRKPFLWTYMQNSNLKSRAKHYQPLPKRYGDVEE